MFITPSERLLVHKTKGQVGHGEPSHDLQVNPSLQGTSFLVRLGSSLPAHVLVDGGSESHLLGCRGMAGHLLDLVLGGLRVLRQPPLLLFSLNL